VDLPPMISIVIPAYDSHRTLGACLEAIDGQSVRADEVIVVDSGPSDRSERLVRAEFPWVMYERASTRLLPHAARNRGVEISSAQMIVFTDPDIYPRQDWLAHLLSAQQRTGGIVVGSVACFGRRWLDMGTHLAKFDIWLPGNPPGDVTIAPTLNMMCPRAIFDDLGGFQGNYMIGDTLFSWEAIARGHRISFEPEAVVVHEHLSSWGQLLRERIGRGAEFGAARADRNGWDRGRSLRQLLISIIPVRLTGLMLRTLRHAWVAGLLGYALATSPIITTAHAAWLFGESRAYLASLADVG
jgi:glycosyltransferase involved in cell wall biosynthesis